MTSETKCPIPPTLSPEQIKDTIPDVLRAMGIQSCKTAAGGVISLIPPIAGGFSVSVGCDQLSVTAQKYYDAKNIMTCFMNSVKSTVKASTLASQTINIIIKDHASMDCPGGLILHQDMMIDIYNKNNFSTNAADTISDKLIEFIKEGMKSIQSSTTGYLATPQGEKSIADAITSINMNLTTKVVTDIVNNALTMIDTKQEITLELTGYSFIRGNQCTVTQDILLKAAIDNMFNTTIQNTYDLEAVTKFWSEQDTWQKNEAKGIESIASFLGIGAIVMLVIFLMGGKVVESVFKYIIPIAIIADIIVLVIYARKKEWLIVGVCGAIFLILMFMAFRIYGKKKNGKKTASA